MALLQHSDKILTAKPGQHLVFCEEGKATNMRAGGVIGYKPGKKLRVNFVSGELVWCLDDNARTVTLDRQEMAAVEICHAK